VIHFRRLCVLLLGAWFGASVVADVAVTQNFQAVDRFLASPGSDATSTQLDSIGRDRERAILRRNAAEENNWIFINWERAEFVLGAALLAVLITGHAQPRKLLLIGGAGLFAIVAAEHLLLTPRIVEMGRFVEDLPKTDDRYKTFWIFHGFYSGLDILKMVVIFLMAARLLIRHKTDPGAAIPEHALAGSAVLEGKRQLG